MSNLSPNTVERDIHDFFSFCGDIERIALQRLELFIVFTTLVNSYQHHIIIILSIYPFTFDSAGNESKVAYVAFRHAHALETAVLLSV